MNSVNPETESHIDLEFTVSNAPAASAPQITEIRLEQPAETPAVQDPEGHEDQETDPHVLYVNPVSPAQSGDSRVPTYVPTVPTELHREIMQRAWFLRVIFPKQGHGSLSDYPPTKSDAEVSIHTTWVAARKLITAKNKTVTAGQETGVSIIIQPETADMHNWESHRIGVVTVRSPDSMARGTVEITRVAADRQRADALVTFRAESKAALFNLLNLLKDPPGQRGVLRQVLTQLSTRRVA